MITNSAKATQALGKKFVKKLKAGGMFGLVGELGSGKTQFVKGIAQGLGIKQKITSPTFVLMRVYPVMQQGKSAKHKTIKRLVHVDAYRLKQPHHLQAIGLEDYLVDPTALIVVEWADKVRSIMPRQAKIIDFKHKSLLKREISL